MKTRGVLTALALTGLTTGAVWSGVAADTQAPPPRAVTSVAAPPIVDGGRVSYADVVKVVTPAVVTIHTEGRARVSQTQFPDDDLFRRFFGDQFEGPQQRRVPTPRLRRGLGSGVVVTGDGHILTNHHVVAGASEIRAEFADGQSYPAKLVGSDQATDLALLKIEATSLRPLTLGDSDAVQVGDVVLAVGNPLGIGQTVTSGIVSAKGRSTGVGDGSYEDFLQTDAPINQGNSGGALVNTRGELIGINSQIISVSEGNIGIGFAIPANMARHVMEQLRTEGRVRRSQLGVSVQPLTPDMAESLGLSQTRGAIVGAVEPSSAAARAGVQRGDVIVAFNGQPITDYNALRNRVAEAKPGSDATIGIIRDGKERTISVKLDEARANRSERGAGADAPEATDQTALGVAVAPLTPETAARVGGRRDLKGLLVQNVAPDSRAADAGIRTGDVIVEANRKPVTSVDELRAAVKSSADRPLLLLVHREGQDLFMTVRAS